MKTKTLLLYCILCLSVLIILGRCATMKSPDKLTYERFCGIWVNKDYEPGPGSTSTGGKLTINPDGTWQSHLYILGWGPTNVGFYTVEKRWTDTDSNSYYHVILYNPIDFYTRYELWRIDKYNAVFELNYSNIDYPDAIDPTDKHSSYRIYYRF